MKGINVIMISGHSCWREQNEAKHELRPSVDFSRVKFEELCELTNFPAVVEQRKFEQGDFEFNLNPYGLT